MPGIRRQPDHPSDTKTIPPPPRPPTILIANVVQAETVVILTVADMIIERDRQQLADRPWAYPANPASNRATVRSATRSVAGSAAISALTYVRSLR